MLKIIRKQNLIQINGFKYKKCIRSIHNSMKPDEEGELPSKARIVICGSGLVGSR